MTKILGWMSSLVSELLLVGWLVVAIVPSELNPNPDINGLMTSAFHLLVELTMIAVK
jgi:hypothetical protein